jgi:hypothetical protein
MTGGDRRTDERVTVHPGGVPDVFLLAAQRLALPVLKAAFRQGRSDRSPPPDAVFNRALSCSTMYVGFNRRPAPSRYTYERPHRFSLD